MKDSFDSTVTSDLVTAAALSLLWGKGPMTIAPLTSSLPQSMTTSTPSSSSTSLSTSSTSTSTVTNPNSPASNAAAALLVGMSMRRGHQHVQEAVTVANTRDGYASKPNQKQKPLAGIGPDAPVRQQHPPQPQSSMPVVAAALPEEAVDIELTWRTIRSEIFEQTDTLSLVRSSGERSGIETASASTDPSPEPQSECQTLELPKGVTRRPSGAWQAQIYFAGKTRYIGVWETARQAATAYNLAKDALKKFKAKQRQHQKQNKPSKSGGTTTEHSTKPTHSHCKPNRNGKRQRLADTMTTPSKELEESNSNSNLPPSITWPSSASSSSTISSSGFRSPASLSYATTANTTTSINTASGVPFKKRRGPGQNLPPRGGLRFDDTDVEAPRGTARARGVSPTPPSQWQQQHPPPPQGLGVRAPFPPPTRSHVYSAFSQHLHPQQQQQQQRPINSNVYASLAHPALQLLSLRPPQPRQQPSQHLWRHTHPHGHAHPPPPHYHNPQQHYHHALHQRQHQLPYAPPLFPPTEGSPHHGRKTAKIQGVHQRHPETAKGGKKKPSKNKGSKASSIVRKKNKITNTNASADVNGHETRDAQNQKWKSIRSEVLAVFDRSKKKRKIDGENNNAFDSGGSDGSVTKTFDKDVLRGITVRPSGKFQAQLYFGGRSRYIGVFDSEHEAASSYEMIRSRLKDESKKEGSPSSASSSSSTVSSIPNCKDDKAKATSTAAAAAAATTMMRSITPSPTPRGNGRGEATKIVT